MILSEILSYNHAGGIWFRIIPKHFLQRTNLRIFPRTTNVRASGRHFHATTLQAGGSSCVNRGGSAHGTGSGLSVAMHSAEEVVDAEIGEKNGGGEDQGVDVVGTVTPQER